LRGEIKTEKDISELLQKLKNLSWYILQISHIIKTLRQYK
jgi:ABC-type Mn2+/Zn2+ transport system ATPase subunit